VIMELSQFIAQYGLVLLFLAMAGAALELDSYFIGVSLLSQPIIAGGIAGFILGDIGNGIYIGAIVQLIWLMPPVGAYVPPSAAAITIVATATSVLLKQHLPEYTADSVNMYSVIGGACVGYFMGQMDIWNRKFNTRIMKFFEPGILKGRDTCILGIMSFAVLAKYLRDFLVYFGFMALGIPLAEKILVTLPPQVLKAFQLSFAFLPVLGFAVIFDIFVNKVGGIFHGIAFVGVFVLLKLRPDTDVLFLFIVLLCAGFIVVYNAVWNRRQA